MNTRSRQYLAFTVVATLSAVACGSDSTDDSGVGPDATATDTGAADVPADASDGTGSSDGPVDGDDPTTADSDDLADWDPTIPPGKILLGEGGFFGVSGGSVGRVTGSTGGAFAIGAHYADISDTSGDPRPSGRVYLFDNGTIPSSLTEATLVLEPPDGSLGGGFGWAIANPCDFNGDGDLDLAVGNHLHSEGSTGNCGRAVVFWGGERGLTDAQHTYHLLSTDLRASSDSLGQTVLCADFDGDGFDDLLASGQNGGAADTGIAAIFYGSESGLADHPDRALYPTHQANRQYFGSASLWADLDGDDREDLAIGGWGLIKGDASDGPHTGGVAVFTGGDDWTEGPSYGVFPPADDAIQLGSSAVAFETSASTLLAVSAPDYGQPATGAVLVWRAGFTGFQNEAPLHVLEPFDRVPDTGFGGALAFVPDAFGRDRGALLVGMKYGDASATLTGTGVVAAYPVTSDGSSLETHPIVLTAPDPQPNDAFGGAIVPLDDIDGDGVRDFFIGMESHVEGDFMTGVQTGGVVFF